MDETNCVFSVFFALTNPSWKSCVTRTKLEIRPVGKAVHRTTPNDGVCVASSRMIQKRAIVQICVFSVSHFLAVVTVSSALLVLDETKKIGEKKQKNNTSRSKSQIYGSVPLPNWENTTTCLKPNRRIWNHQVAFDSPTRCPSNFSSTEALMAKNKVSLKHIKI